MHFRCVRRHATARTTVHMRAAYDPVLSPPTARRSRCAATNKASERGMAIQAGVATCELKRGLAARSLRNAPGETLSPSVPRRRLGGGGGGGRAGDSLWQHPPHSHWISEPISQDCAWQGVASVTGAECGTPPGVRGRRQRAERRGQRAESRGQSSYHVRQVVDALEVQAGVVARGGRWRAGWRGKTR